MQPAGVCAANLDGNSSHGRAGGALKTAGCISGARILVLLGTRASLTEVFTWPHTAFLRFGNFSEKRERYC